MGGESFTRGALVSLSIAAAFAIGAICASPESNARLVATQSKLDQRIPSFNTDREPLAAVIDRLQSLSALPMHIDWASLKASGVSADAPITAMFRDTPLRVVLKTAFEDAADDNGHLYQFEIDDDGTLQITPEAELPKLYVTRTYDIRDLRNRIEFPQWPGSPPSMGVPLPRLLTDAVESDSWAVNGGAALIDENDGRLVVTNTQQNQRAIEQVVLQLRDQEAARSLQRFLDPSLDQ